MTKEDKIKGARGQLPVDNKNTYTKGNLWQTVSVEKSVLRRWKLPFSIHNPLAE